MSDERRRKKRSEKLSDSFAARLGREIGTSDRIEALAGDTTARETRAARQELASLGSVQRHSFTRCPHCKEFVPIRDNCRSCDGPLN